MTDAQKPDWDPSAPAVLADQIAAYDRLRLTCPVAYATTGTWAVFKHADVVYMLDNPGLFSNAVSRHVAVPNGMDPPAHTAFRAVVDRYFRPNRMAAFEPAVRTIAVDLVSALPRGDVEVMTTLAEPFASRAQCSFMGWPESLRGALQQWTKDNQAAMHLQDRKAMAAVATAFDGYIRTQLDVRRTAGADAPLDPTTALWRDEVDGRRLTDDEIVSIVRNWTVGELGTIAASVGIVALFLATRRDVQARLRSDIGLAGPTCDEILRIHPPLIANRRRTTEPVRLGGREIPADQTVMAMWASANRDEDVFGDPDEFRLDRDPNLNLLYGRGIHACPGAPLARLELRVLVEELVRGTNDIAATADRPTRARYPAAGFSRLPLRIS